MCSIIGAFAIGSIGFGWLLVSGRSRVPSPPARITAFMNATSLRTSRAVLPSRNATRAAGHVFRRREVPEHDPADREAPTRARRTRCAPTARRRRSGTSAARTSARGCPPCPPTRRRCGARRRARAPTVATAIEDLARQDDPEHRRRLRSTGLRATARSPPRRASTRSAVGSRILPSSLPWLKCRAIQPSTQSVAPRTASSTAAPRRAGSGFQSIQRNTGTHSNRADRDEIRNRQTLDRA